MNLKIAQIGFGCYRIDIRDEEHYKALKFALLNGINLIDTSSNYSDGGSEELVGKVVSDLIEEGKIKRSGITIVTKAGYIQGQNYKRALQLKAEGKLFSEVVELQDKLWHSISPEFIEDQINRQLSRLMLDYADVYLLHNPEYFLNWAEVNNLSKDDAREIYYDRIRKAFEFLESKTAEGKIKCYGISSNTFVSHSDEYNFTSLEKCVDIANSISVNNYFKVIQFPFNLFEAGALRNKNQINNTETILELANRSGLKTLVNRPLNAVTSKGLVRLSEFYPEPFLEKDFIKQMKHVSLMEDDLLEKIKTKNLDEQDLKSVREYLRFGNLISKDWKFYGTIENYNDTVRQLFAPRIDFLVKYFENKIQDSDLKNSFTRYAGECYKLFNFVSNYYKLRASRRSHFINSIIDKDLNEKYHRLSLSQKAVLLLSSVVGVDCVLAGMRSENYVRDLIEIFSIEKIENAREIILNVSKEIELNNV